MWGLVVRGLGDPSGVGCNRCWVLLGASARCEWELSLVNNHLFMAVPSCVQTVQHSDSTMSLKILSSLIEHQIEPVNQPKVRHVFQSDPLRTFTL